MLKNINNADNNNTTIRIFFASVGAAAYIFNRYRLLKKDCRKLVDLVVADRERINPAMRFLTELVTDIANASFVSGDSDFMLAKRINRIISSPRGEGKTIRDAFVCIADCYESGLMSWLHQEYPQMSPTDIAVCGLMSVGLDPGCICKIMGYEHEQTFYNKRSEVRKKLGLAHNVPLEAFLNVRIQQLREQHDSVLTQFGKGI